MQKRRTIMKSFVTFQFGHCPLIWIFHSTRLNNKITSAHERPISNEIIFGNEVLKQYYWKQQQQQQQQQQQKTS